MNPSLIMISFPACYYFFPENGHVTDVILFCGRYRDTRDLDLARSRNALLIPFFDSPQTTDDDVQQKINNNTILGNLHHQVVGINGFVTDIVFKNNNRKK